MTGMATAALPAQGGVRQTIWRRIVHFIWMFNGYYLRHRRREWRESPDIRHKIQFNIIALWAEAWVVASWLVINGLRYDYLFLPFGITCIIFIAAIIWFDLGRDTSALTSASTIAILAVFWLAMVYMPVLIFNDRGNLSSSIGRFIFNAPFSVPYLLWGWFWIAFIYLISIRMPIWIVRIRYGEVYLVEDRNHLPEGFRLLSRPDPLVDQSIIHQLMQAGVSKSAIEKFLHFNGPRYMRESLTRQLTNPNSPQVQQVLNQLYQQVADQNRIPPPILWVSALDHHRLLWNHSESISVNFTIEELITHDGHSLEIMIYFKCNFDPQKVLNPDFRINLANFYSPGTVADFIASIAEAAARGQARLYFVNLSLDQALTRGTIDDFRRELPELLDGLSFIGIVLNPITVECRPIVPLAVKDAEIEMRRSRADAVKDTAKLQTLVDKIVRQGLSPEMVNRLLFLDQSTTGDYKAFQINSDASVLPLLNSRPPLDPIYSYPLQQQLAEPPNTSDDLIILDQSEPAPQLNPGETVEPLHIPKERRDEQPVRRPRIQSNLGDKRDEDDD